MNTSRILIPAAWLLSVAAAFMIGQKKQPSSSETSPSAEQKNSSYLPYSRRSTAGNSSSSRKNSHSRQTSKNSSTSDLADLNISTIANNNDPIDRASDLLKLISTLGPNDFKQVVADFRALGITGERMSEYGMLLHAWAKTDPLGALDYAEQNTGTQFARQTILTSWAGTDPESAILWAKEHHTGEKANPWLIGVIRGIASNDPTRATEVLHDLPLSRERGTALASIIPHIASQGHETAIRWLDTITDDRLHIGATSYLAASLAKTDAPATADWVSTLGESEEKARAAGEVADQWADDDLPSAIAWTDTLDGNSKSSAAREIIGPYAKENPSEAAAWLHTMTDDPKYNDISRSYIWNTARSHPEFSLAQVGEIQDPKTQERYYERILKRWKSQEADAAQTWMDNHQVSDELREKVNQ